MDEAILQNSPLPPVAGDGAFTPAPAAPARNLLWRLRLLLVLFALCIFLPGIFSLPPSDRDESRFAQATKQMTETGDYTNILNGSEKRNKKPIGIHWLQAPVVLAAGAGLKNPIWPYRIPSVLGGLAAVLAVFEIGLALTGRPRIAAMAGLMLSACVILATETHIAKTDAALLGATTICMAVLARAWLGCKLARWQAALFWLALAAGILLKGPITPMVAGLTVLTLCLWERRVGWLRALRAAWGVPLLFLTVTPWFVAIGLATHGAFFAQAVGGDLGKKLAGGAEAHGGFFGLHALLMPLLAFPSTVPVLLALPAAWADRRDAGTRFLLAWLVPSWLVFEMVPTKLPHYTLPLYPALFLLAARFLDAAGGLAPRWWRWASKVALVAAGCVLGAAATALPIFLHAAWWLGIPALAGTVLVTLLAVRKKLLFALAAAPLLYAAILQLELPHVPGLWIAPRVEAVVRAEWPGWNSFGKGLVVAGYAEPSLMFLGGTDTRFLPDGAQAATALAGSASIAVVSDVDERVFAEKARALGLEPREVGRVKGFNYSRGKWMVLEIFRK
jgi:4-amino-4-deoxy-L-arabinose transferase-like glycosyltransferase